MSKYYLHNNCSLAECFPEKSSQCLNGQVGQGVKDKAVWMVRWTGHRVI